MFFSTMTLSLSVHTPKQNIKKVKKSLNKTYAIHESKLRYKTYPFFRGRSRSHSEKSWTHVSWKMQFIYVILKWIHYQILGCDNFSRIAREPRTLWGRSYSRVWACCGIMSCGDIGMRTFWFGTQRGLVGWTKI